MSSRSGYYDLNGYGYSSRFEWSIASQNTSGNYTVINWKWRTLWSDTTAWVISAQARLTVNGETVYSAGFDTSRRLYGSRDVASGQATIRHDGNGNASFSASGEAAFYYHAINARGSGSWTLPQISRPAPAPKPQPKPPERRESYEYTPPPAPPAPTLGFQNLTESAPTPNDIVIISYPDKVNEGESIRVVISNPDRLMILGRSEVFDKGGNRWLSLPSPAYRIGSSNQIETSITVTEEDKAFIQRYSASSDAVKLRIIVEPLSSSSLRSHTVVIRYLLRANAPKFSSFTCRDANATTSALTQDATAFIQNHSQVTVNIGALEQMRPQGGASPQSYSFQLGSVMKTLPSGQAVGTPIQLGKPTESGSNQKVIVRAIDSRGKSTTVEKNINVIPYAPVKIRANIARENARDSGVTLKISAHASSIKTAQTERNQVTTLRYRYHQRGAATWRNWNPVDRDSTSAGINFTTNTIFLDLDKSKEWEIEVEAKDRIGTYSKVFPVLQGDPILFISTERRVGVNKVPQSRALEVEGAIEAEQVFIRKLTLDGSEVTKGRIGTIETDLATLKRNNNQNKASLDKIKTLQDDIASLRRELKTLSSAVAQTSKSQTCPFPVGSVLITNNSNNPSSIWSGTSWESFGQGRTIFGVSSYEREFSRAGTTGGEKTVRLTEGQMPRHQHKLSLIRNNGYSSASGVVWEYSTRTNKYGYSADMIEPVGRGEAHNNLPPYIAMHMWRRTR